MRHTFAAGNLQWLTPVLKFLYAHSKHGEVFDKLYKTALELVRARRTSETKVISASTPCNINIIIMVNAKLCSIRTCYNL